MSRVSQRTSASYRGLLDEMERAERLAREPETCAVRVDSVSHWSVLQQLDHLLKTDAAILDGLRQNLKDNAPNEPGGPTFMGWFVLLTGFIPRGKGKAPEFVLPSDRSPGQIAAGFDFQ